jgi:polyvinyl alcohol dehydrogenase (cytochrome)
VKLSVNLLTIAVLAFSVVVFAQNKKSKSTDWTLFGRDLAASHYNPDERTITPTNVANLKVKWTFEAGDDISTQPIVANGVVYFGSWDGKEYAVDAKTGKRIWEFDCGQSSRASAAYENGLLAFVDVAGFLYVLDAKTGTQKWKKRIDTHRNTVGTGAPILYQGRIYIGVPSHEEGAMLGKRDYVCCTFRGSVVSFDAATGNELWRWWVLPEPAIERGEKKNGQKWMGPSGGAIWSTVSLDPAAKRLYVTTGNQYTGPNMDEANAIVALDMNTGKRIWTFKGLLRDIWNFDCKGTPDCDDLDYDFGSQAIFFKGPNGKRLVGAGQKSGWFFAVNQADGTLVWKTEVGPGGKLGGIEFGDATDGERVYAAISNHPKQGSVSALDAATGKVLWKTPSPDNKANFGPITVTGRGNNRLVWAGSVGNFVRAYDASNGKILWEFDTGGAVGGGITVVDGTVYVGSGYKFLRIGKGNNKLYAFSF